MVIKPYPKNAKKHPEKQLRAIAESLKAFGWRQPIVVDKNDEIIVGHGRWLAWEKFGKELELSEPWIEKAEDLTPQKVKAYRLADNKLNESEWEMALAMEELQELDAYHFKLTGFEDLQKSGGLAFPKMEGGGVESRSITVYYEPDTMTYVEEAIGSHEGSNISEKFLALIQSHPKHGDREV